MDVYHENIPDSADKRLFSGDVVSYVMTRLLNSPYEASFAASHRGFIFDAFNENIKIAVDYLCARLQIVNGAHLKIIRELRISDRNRYLAFAQRLRNIYFSEGFEPKYFLYYCIELSILASLFRENGLPEAPDIATACIFHSLRNYDMFCGGWDALNAAAAKYVCLSVDRNNMLTPELPQVVDELGNELDESAGPSEEDGSFNMVPEVVDGNEISEDENLHEANNEEPSTVPGTSDENPELNRESTNSSIRPVRDVQTALGNCENCSAMEDCKPRIPVADSVSNVTKMHALDAKYSTVHEEMGKNSLMPPTSIKNEELQHHNGFQCPQIRDVTKDTCSTTAAEHGSKEYISCQLPGSIAEHSGSKELNNPSNTSTKAFVTCSDTEITRAKRSSGCYKANRGKKMRLSAI